MQFWIYFVIIHAIAILLLKLFSFSLDIFSFGRKIFREKKQSKSHFSEIDIFTFTFFPLFDNSSGLSSSFWRWVDCCRIPFISIGIESFFFFFSRDTKKRLKKLKKENTTGCKSNVWNDTRQQIHIILERFIEYPDILSIGIYKMLSTVWILSLDIVTRNCLYSMIEAVECFLQTCRFYSMEESEHEYDRKNAPSVIFVLFHIQFFLLLFVLFFLSLNYSSHLIREAQW